MQSNASTPEEYIAGLPEDRKAIISEIRKTILKALPKGFAECMNYGMLCYNVPLSLYPAGYHCDPKLGLPFISLASQKNYISFHHMALYNGSLLEWFKDEWPKHSSKKLDMGKCCVRFKKPEDVPMKLLEELSARMTPDQWIAAYEKALNRN